MDRAVDIQDEGSASFAALLKSAFIRRSVGVIAIGLVNLLVLAALGAAFFLLLPVRGSWHIGSPLGFVVVAMSAMLMAFSVLFASFMVLVTQSLMRRAAVGGVVLFFLVIALFSPGVGSAVGSEHFIVFWLCVLILIPLRA